jgi:hypothetical protein
MRFLIIFLLFSTSVFSHETKFPYDYFETEAIYHLDTGQIIYVEKYVHGYILWEKNATGRLNKLSPFRGFYGIAKECEAFEHSGVGRKFKNIVFGVHKEYYYWGGINEFPIRMYHLYERNAHVSYRTDLGLVMNMEEAHSWCTFYEPINQ